VWRAQQDSVPKGDFITSRDPGAAVLRYAQDIADALRIPRASQTIGSPGRINNKATLRWHVWRAQQDSNLRPLVSETNTLSN
jgi:hypothetical protein